MRTLFCSTWCVTSWARWYTSAAVGRLRAGSPSSCKAGIGRAEHPRFAHAGADAIGLVFWPGTPRQVTFDQARAIVVALPAFVTVVGLFVDPQPEEVNAALAAVPLDLLQFHGDERPELCASFGRPYIKAIPVRPGVDLLQYAARFDAARGLL